MTKLSISASTPLGETYEGTPRRLSLERVRVFSGGRLSAADWPAKNLHTDEGKAAEAGLGTPIASGLQSQGHLIRLLLNLFGDEWWRSGSMHLRFLKPVHIDDVVTAKLRLTGFRRTDGRTIAEMDGWCERLDGESVLSGRMECSLPEVTDAD